jgi:hypothetical protein
MHSGKRVSRSWEFELTCERTLQLKASNKKSEQYKNKASRSLKSGSFNK